MHSAQDIAFAAAIYKGAFAGEAVLGFTSRDDDQEAAFNKARKWVDEINNRIGTSNIDQAFGPNARAELVTQAQFEKWRSVVEEKGSSGQKTSDWATNLVRDWAGSVQFVLLKEVRR